MVGVELVIGLLVLAFLAGMLVRWAKGPTEKNGSVKVVQEDKREQ